MPRALWNHDEQRALYGLSLLARVVYLQVLRWRMDYATGIVGGDGRRMSYAAIAEVVDFVPDKGSRRRLWKPTKEQLRAVIRELIRAGLIENAGSSRERGLVFLCLLADRDKSVQNMNPTGTPQRNPTINNTHIVSHDKELHDVGHTMNPTDETNMSHTCCGAMNPTPPVSGISYSVAHHGSKLPRARVDRDAMVSCFADLGFSHTNVHTPKVIGMIERWCAAGVEIDDVVCVVGVLRGQGRQFTPAYLDKPMMQFLEQKKQPQGTDDEEGKRVHQRSGDAFAENLFGSPDPGLRS
ncbi:MAG: hypothetical protein KZQ95_01870 [Candidatus Thiodiazotropha sp. (ex Epidulcina cf. delphinae)]|nr:hypothetical protein [Candidatus Thiodiazotropha sp. (ex Epidulcina cf. delphinae)]